MNPLSPQELRKAFSSFATGVTVITGIDSHAEAIGITISSFNTVSLEPPLVLWSLSERSTFMPNFEVGHRQLIHVLERSQEDLAMRFAKTNSDQFSGLEYQTQSSGLVKLSGCAAYLECETIATYPGGDHRIIVARVHEFAYDLERDPLIFSRSQFMGLNLPEKSLS